MRKQLPLLCQAFAFLLIVGGLLLFSVPLVCGAWTEQSAKAEVKAFQQTVAVPQKETPDSSTSDEPTKPVHDHYIKVYDAFLAYNARLSNEGQRLHGEESYEQMPETLARFWDEDEPMGYITIPKMGVELPLYIGASDGHLSKGAAVLGETSLPIGTENSNSVISAHRGYRGAAFFRDIELLEIGDVLSVTNLWDTLSYRVSEIKVVQPSEVQPILLQQGKDMITLLTCHPYRSGGQYRYLVFCERVPTQQEAETAVPHEEQPVSSTQPSEEQSVESIPYMTSQEDIMEELMLQKLGGVVMFAGVIMLGYCLLIPKSLQRQRK